MGCNTSKQAAVCPPTDYRALDEHARQAPESTRDSIDGIYEYLSSISTNQQSMVRLIFVWITEFIGHSSGESKEYDPLDGKFDVLKILQAKSTGSTGYTKLFDALCSRASIPVQKIQGFVKTINHSPDHPFTTSTTPNHAWNAVQIDGQWTLVDCMWGAGHLHRDGQYKRHFDDLYFMTDPKTFILTHFPLINTDIEASKRWQLIKKPITLDEFNKRLAPCPEAFKFQVDPTSHIYTVIEVKGQSQIAFKINDNNPMIFMSSIWLVDDNKLIEQPNQTFDTIQAKEYSIRVRPSRIGTYHLRIFGGRNEIVGKEVEDLPLLFRYIIKCTEIIDETFEFPEVSERALTNQCILLQPLSGKLIRGSVVTIHLKCANIDELMINGKAIKGEMGEFKGSLELNVDESTLTIFGTKENSDKYIPLYGFEIV